MWKQGIERPTRTETSSQGNPEHVLAVKSDVVWKAWEVVNEDVCAASAVAFQPIGSVTVRAGAMIGALMSLLAWFTAD